MSLAEYKKLDPSLDENKKKEIMKTWSMKNNLGINHYGLWFIFASIPAEFSFYVHC